MIAAVFYIANSKNRSSHWRCSMKKTVLNNFAKFTGKQLCQSLFFNKRLFLTFFKRETLAQLFSCEFCEIFQKTLFTEHLRRTTPIESHNFITQHTKYFSLQADACHAYHVVHSHGIPEENIVMMIYDDIANNPQ